MAKRRPRNVGVTQVEEGTRKLPPVPTAPLVPRDENIIEGSSHGTRRESEADTKRRAKVARLIKDSIEEQLSSAGAESELREEMRTDQAFEAGEQWDGEIEYERLEDDRPVLKINRLPQFKAQVANQLSRAKARIQYSPANDDADDDVALVLQGMAHNIETQSESDTQYSGAVNDQLVIGRGWIQLKNEWATNDSMKQVIRFKHLRNPFSVFPDPTVQEFEYDDMRHCHIVRDIPSKTYDKLWGKVSPSAGIQSMQGASEIAPDWMPEGKVRVAERYWLEYETRVLLLLEDGTEIYKDIYDELQSEITRLVTQTGTPSTTDPAATPQAISLPKPIQKREVPVPTVKWMLHNAVDILEGNDAKDDGRRLPGTRIPVFPMIGNMRDLDGKLDFRGMVRDARDPQRMYNFWASSIAETVTLAPKAPWVVAEGQIAGYEELWEDANRKTFSTLPYNPVTVDGLTVPPPQRQVAEPPIQAMVLGLKEADNDLKAVMGLFDPSLGQVGPEQSGKAILARQRQGDIANSNYQDNRDRCIRAIGRSLLEWIPEVYDVARVEHIVFGDKRGADKQPVMIHGGRPETIPTTLPPGVEKIYDLSVGRYNVEVQSGAADGTKRQETEAWMIELYKAAPGLLATTIDIFLENSDAPVAKQMAKRAKLMLPPELQDGNDPETQLAKTQGQLKQLSQQHAMMAAALNKATDLIKGKQVEGNYRVLVAMIAAQAQLAAVAAKIGSQGDLAAFQQEFQRMTQVMEHVHERISTEMDQTFQAQQAALPEPGEAAPAGPAVVGT